MSGTLRTLKRQKNLLVGGAITAAIVLMAICAPLLAPYDPVDQADLLHAEEAPNRAFLFGTDTQGRDILSRVIYGARVSLAIGLIAQCLNSIIGVVLGLSAGFLGRWWDDLVMGLTNIMLSIPALVLALAIMAVLGPGLFNVFLALGFTNWSYSCRVARSQVLAARSLDYVMAARALGQGRVRIMLQQILTEASLSFLGLGAQPPTPSWGGMLSTAREQLFTAPWISIFPGLAIFVTVLGLNLLGDGLRDVLDPRTTRTRR